VSVDVRRSAVDVRGVVDRKAVAVVSDAIEHLLRDGGRQVTVSLWHARHVEGAARRALADAAQALASSGRRLHVVGRPSSTDRTDEPRR
jgi:anti-anti-sigma regulatory factor